MLAKMFEYKGVIIFYLILALIFATMAYRNNQIDTHSTNNDNIVSYY